MPWVIVANHLLLCNPLCIDWHTLIHQVLILVKLLVLMLLPVHCLVGVPPLVQALLVLRVVLAVVHVIILEVLAHCGSSTDGVEVVHLDCVLKSLLHLAVVFGLLHRHLLLVLVHAGDCAHAGLCRLLLSQILLLVNQMLLVLFLYLWIVQSVVLALVRRVLVFDTRVALPMHWTILLGEVLCMRLYQLPWAGHPLAHCVERIAAVLMQSCLFRSLHLFGTVGVSSRLML